MGEYKNQVAQETTAATSVGLTYSPAAPYRLFLLDDQSHIAGVKILEGVDDEAARLAAATLLENQEEHQTAELWHLARRVDVLKR